MVASSSDVCGELANRLGEMGLLEPSTATSQDVLDALSRVKLIVEG